MLQETFGLRQYGGRVLEGAAAAAGPDAVGNGVGNALGDADAAGSATAGRGRAPSGGGAGSGCALGRVPKAKQQRAVTLFLL